MRRLILPAAILSFVAAFSAPASAQSPIDIVEPWIPIQVSPFPISAGPHDLRPMPPTIGPSAIAPHERATLSADATALIASNTRFGLDIYQQLSLASKPADNVLVSPLSISAALAMTYAGARGQTAQQMADILRFTLSDDRMHPAFGELLRDLTASRDGYQLSIANRLFAQQSYPFEDAFRNVTAMDYDAPMEEADFRADPEVARNRINQWVAGQTNDKIRDLLPAGTVRKNTRLVLTNAIYFNGSWKYHFDKDFTRAESFDGANGAQSTVSMMHQSQTLAYAERPGYQMLELPYAGDDLSLVVMLPTLRDGLRNLESLLTPDEWKAGLDAMYQTSVNVSLPKFTFDSAFKLVDTLKAMGMTQAFDKSRADLTGIADPNYEKLYIDDVLHKAFIDVNEEGTEAAAATAVVIGAITTCLCAPPPPKMFNADHPFLFALRDMHSGSLLFLGRVVDPGSLTSASSALVPEPASMLQFVVGVVALAWIRGRRF